MKEMTKSEFIEYLKGSKIAFNSILESQTVRGMLKGLGFKNASENEDEADRYSYLYIATAKDVHTYRLDNGLKVFSSSLYKQLTYDDLKGVFVRDWDSSYDFKPFDRVLVRTGDTGPWIAASFSHIKKVKTESGSERTLFIADCQAWSQCIPYKGNECMVGSVLTPKK